MKSAEFILHTLEKAGVEYIFGIPGGAIEELSKALDKNKNITPIVTRHEAGAAYMADGYARVTGKLGACFSTAGPGATNLVTGLATSYVDRIPVCALTGQVAMKSFGRQAFQESSDEGVDMVNIFRPITKYSGLVMSKYRVQHMIEKAVRLARSVPGGPVHLSLPVNVMKKEIPQIMPSSPLTDERLFDRKKVERAAFLLAHAKKPVIIAGWGVVLSQGAHKLMDLAQLLNIPVATSPKAKGIFPESHPLSLGVLGFAGSPAAREYIFKGDIDVLVAVGTSFNEMTTEGWEEIPFNDLIHIDADVEKIGKNYPTTLGLVGDAKTVMKEIVFAVRRELGAKRDETFLRDIANHSELSQIKGKHAAAQIRQESKNDRYHPETLIADIQKSFPKDTVYFVEIGAVMAWAIQHLVMDKPYSFYVSMGFGGMGYATAACAGAKLGLKDRPVVALCGDGGFMMHGMEVSTAVSHNIPVIWLIFNNGMYGMIHHGRKMLNPPIPEGIPTRFARPDFAKIAEGFGAKGVSVKKTGELTRELVQEVISESRPAIIDVWIDEEIPPPLGSRVRSVAQNFEDLLPN
ncbi:thiamine pyrophosphate-binding protein [Desulfonema magnum]|uniref:Thiamine pyrophosphate enzyme family protein n=1 Tax=Desulfonema magnum TaxID=45655 RepID=A0A975BLB6_9BACT|nr:thiamine pyrophosphate-binding protein [Desulfonema magnum]QTA87189.1 Thiamine pyrophosphate enzyme family protein [Desulfonema magnum]